jgi:hypothetical protein
MEAIKSQAPAVSFHDKITAKGVCEVFTRKKGEEWKKQRHIENLTVNLGVNLIRDRMFTSSSNYIRWGAVSDNTTAPAAANTSLGGNETTRQYFQNGAADTTTNYEAYVEFYIDSTQWAAATPSAMTTVSKAGLYYASTGNYLYCAASFTPLNVDTATEMLVTWTVSYADA